MEGKVPNTVEEERVTIRFATLCYFLRAASVECLFCAVPGHRSCFHDLIYYLVLTTSLSLFLSLSPLCT